MIPSCFAEWGTTDTDLRPVCLVLFGVVIFSTPRPVCQRLNHAACVAMRWRLRFLILRRRLGRQLVQSRAEGEGEMKLAKPRQWTEAEVRRLKTLTARKVSAEDIAKLLGRSVGSVKIKSRWLGLVPFRKAK